MFKVIIRVIPLFILGWALGTGFAISNYPKKALAESVTKVMAEAGGAWKFTHARELADATFRGFVKPNVDTVYSLAALDSNMGPHVLEVPAIDRYWTFQFMQDNTDVFAYVGMRTHGLNKTIRVLITPKGYTGETRGLETIEAPTRTSWILARFLVDGPADVGRVNKIQDQIKLIPLGEYK